MIVASVLLAVAFPGKPTIQFDPLKQAGLRNLGAYSLLRELTKDVGNRLSGSPQAAQAVEWGKQTMERLGFENVHLVPCMVPHWVRGDVGTAQIVQAGGTTVNLATLALGGSVATPEGGLEAEVVEVHSLGDVEKLGAAVKGKIVFYNGPMDPTISPFAAYGRAGAQRFAGPATASKYGAVGTLVRSMTTAHDDVPHTGTTTFRDPKSRIPCAAIGVLSAEKLSQELKAGPVKVRMNFNSQWLPDEPSASVVGEIRGKKFPNEVVIMGGHLDSWDVGEGAHDDGSGCVQSLEALNLIRTTMPAPDRTIRVVLFMNEENGGRGGEAFALAMKNSNEKIVAALESDSGGFMPRSFGMSVKPKEVARYQSWLEPLASCGIERFEAGGEGGADIAPLEPLGPVLCGLSPDGTKYFDFHHTQRDTMENVHPFELQHGANAMAILAYLFAQNGKL